MVRLKVLQERYHIALILFQFHMVRLKAMFLVLSLTMKFVSIPYGTIKRISPKCPYLRILRFNSIWYD